jgi:decaprenylphospho-beta-D-erythro-pentofuranosid-2-ulose 2-reductase
MRDGLGRVQNIMIIGGTSEIGCATAAALLRDAGGTIVLAGRDPSGQRLAAQRLRGVGRTVHQLRYDAHQPPEEVAELFTQAARLVGDLDVVLICVGVLLDEVDLAGDIAGTEMSLHTNMLGPALVVHAAGNHLAAQGHGLVVVLSSVAGLRPRRDMPTYSAAKAGLDAYARGVAARLGGTGAKLMVVRPGQVRTRMSAGRQAVPFTVDGATVARVIARHVASANWPDRRARVVYVPGILRPVTWVLRALPTPMFDRLTTAARRGRVADDPSRR